MPARTISKVFSVESPGHLRNLCLRCGASRPRRTPVLQFVIYTTAPRHWRRAPPSIRHSQPRMSRGSLRCSYEGKS